MPIVSGFVVPKMNPTRHVGNIRLLRPVVVAVEHQEDSQAENNESKDKEEPEEPLGIVALIACYFIWSASQASIGGWGIRLPTN